MNLQDLTNNRGQIIRTIRFQGADIQKVMQRMAIWVEHNEEKATKKSINKLTKEAIAFVFRNDDSSVEIIEDMHAHNRTNAMRNLPSSMR